MMHRKFDRVYMYIYPPHSSRLNQPKTQPIPTMKTADLKRLMGEVLASLPAPYSEHIT
ncbi:hypothetical protein SAMN02949497_1220 [Methylomagnum ishizawai]|uniref:Uncharacterized protein n=1 Tax=Methylomagnum ishizawai TaxID=1760988 RepID=A0A1Y6D0J6_9GAMM|nr:hypothetical protein SAMN02949497_1220 [Methylomagnum ishizawai]